MSPATPSSSPTPASNGEPDERVQRFHSALKDDYGLDGLGSHVLLMEGLTMMMVVVVLLCRLLLVGMMVVMIVVMRLRRVGG